MSYRGLELTMQWGLEWATSIGGIWISRYNLKVWWLGKADQEADQEACEGVQTVKTSYKGMIVFKVIRQLKALKVVP